MSMILAAAALMGASGAADTHHVQIDHRGHRVDVVYRSAIDVQHRQTGAVSAPGRPSALSCRWTATIAIQREAVSPRGHVAARTIGSDSALSGSRPGWCAGQRDSIAAEVAARGAAIRDHLLAVAAEDRDRVVADLDAAHDRARS